MNNKNKIGLIAMLAGCVAGNAFAGDFSSGYATGDVLICFRNAGSGVDMVVDAGPISTFLGYSHNSTNPITAYSASNLKNDVGLGNTLWSAFTWDSSYTLYLTKGRATNSLSFQTPAFPEAAYGQQQITAGSMHSIVLGAVANNTYLNSTATAVEEDDDSNGDPNYPSGVSYFRGVTGAYGNSFNGTVGNNPEQKIPKTSPVNLFTSPQRSDFYQLTPSGSGAGGTFLGYFELETNGTMVYVAYPTQLPVINSFTSVNGTNALSYTTGTYGTYTLIGTNNLAAPSSTWPTISTLSTGDTKPHTVTDVPAAAIRFYNIKGTP